MNDNRPICPYCNVDLDYDEMFDETFDTSVFEAHWSGVCPICNRHFRWKEIYHYSHIENLEEEIDNG